MILPPYMPMEHVYERVPTGRAGRSIVFAPSSSRMRMPAPGTTSDAAQVFVSEDCMVQCTGYPAYTTTLAGLYPFASW